MNKIIEKLKKDFWIIREGENKSEIFIGIALFLISLIYFVYKIINHSIGFWTILFFIFGVLSFIVPYLPRLVLLFLKYLSDLLLSFLFDLSEGGKSFKQFFKYTFYPTIILLIAQFFLKPSLSLYKFQIYNNQYMENLMEFWKQNSKVNLEIRYLFLQILLLIFYTVYFYFISKEIKREEKFIKKNFRTGRTYRMYHSIDELKLRWILLAILLASDIICIILTWSILNGSLSIKNAGNFVHIFSIIKIVSFILLLTITQITIFSRYFYRYKIDEDPSYYFNGNQLNLITQLCILAYQNQKDIKSNLDDGSDYGSGINFHYFINGDSTVLDEKFEIFFKDTKNVEQFKKFIRDSTQGFIGSQIRNIDDNDKRLTIYVVFRGTENKFNDQLLDLEFQSTKFNSKISMYEERRRYKRERYVEVHKGFLAGYLSVEEQIKNKVLEILLDNNLDSYSKVEIVFSGHSLGAGIATIAAAKFHLWFEKILRKFKTLKTDKLQFSDILSELEINSKVENVKFEKEQLKISLLELSNKAKVENSQGSKNAKRLSIFMYIIGSPKVGNRHFRAYYSTIGKQRKNLIGFYHIRERNNVEWAAFIPPFYSHILPGIFWDSNGNPKYQQERNKFSFTNIFLHSYSEIFGILIFQILMIPFFIAKGLGIAISPSNHINEPSSNRIFTDHDTYQHLNRLLNELNWNVDHIWFKTIKDEYSNKFEES